jgi:hypothetical protein
VKKLLKFSCIFSLVLIFISSNVVQAATNQVSKKSDFKNILSDKKLISKSKKLQEMVNLSEDKKMISGGEEYINITTKVDKDGKPISSSVKKYNKADYLKVRAKQDLERTIASTSSLSPISTSLMSTLSTMSTIDEYASKDINGWIRLTINVYSSDGTNLDLYGFYEWLSTPLLAADDVFAFAHDSNILFYNESAWSEHYYSWADVISPLNEGSDYFDASNTDNHIQDIGGVGFTFDLANTCGMYDNGEPARPYGLLYVSAKKANTYSEGAQIGLNYAHEKIGISAEPSVSIPLGVSINITALSFYEKVTFSHVIDYTP